MGIPRTNALKRVTKAICGQDGETAQQKNQAGEPQEKRMNRI